MRRLIPVTLHFSKFDWKIMVDGFNWYIAPPFKSGVLYNILHDSEVANLRMGRVSERSGGQI